MTGAMDFGALPPEVNSGLMYAGAGSGPLVAAATAWSNLACELGSAADACAEVLSSLTGAGWHGPAAASMAAAAAPYAAWMRTTAGQVAQAASQASAAVGAYEAAFAATVPPPMVAENRARWLALVATNVFGQNTPAIAATDAAYAEMWAQDAAAMYRYAGDAAAAAVLKPLTTPPATTTATAQAGQAAATSHATASAATSTPADASQLLTAVQNSLQGLGLNVMDPGSGNTTAGLDGLLNFISGSDGATPFSNFLNSTLVNSAIAGAPYSPAFIGQAVGDMTALTTVMGRTLGATSLMSAGSAVPAAAGLSGAGLSGAGLSGMGTLAGAHAEAAAGLGGSAGGSAASASIGKATLVRSLSVPPGWTSLTAAAQPIAAPVAAPPVALPTASPVLTAGMPAAAASSASRMVDKAEDEDVDPPIYGMPTRALTRTPVGG